METDFQSILKLVFMAACCLRQSLMYHKTHNDWGR